MEVFNAANEKKSKKVTVDVKKEYAVSEAMEETPWKASFIFPIPLKESDPDSLISYVNQSVMSASNSMNEVRQNQLKDCIQKYLKVS